MSYLAEPDAGSDQHAVVRLYNADLARQGYVANYTKVFALRPEIYDAWATLAGAIKSGMDLRRYELVTLAAARRLRSSYCSLAHGMVLRDKFHDAGTVHKIAADRREAGLDMADAAIMDFAEKVARDAAGITGADIDTLRRHGLSDVEIFQVVLAVAARCFFSTVLDAVGAEPDAEYRTLVEAELREILTVGRPIAAAGA
jgi:uncharacterized peroxidase-related enzyme